MKARPADFRGTLVGKQIVLFFEKPSLRTRLTFEAGINSLGGTSFFVDQTQSRLGARETAERRRPQPRALDRRRSAAHVCARDGHRDGDGTPRFR